MFKNNLDPYDESEDTLRVFGCALDMAIRYISALNVITCIHRIHGGHPCSDSVNNFTQRLSTCNFRLFICKTYD